MKSDGVSGSEPGAVDRSVVHRCPHCGGRHSVWAKGVFAPGTRLVRKCSECERHFLFEDGRYTILSGKPCGAVHPELAALPRVQCHWRIESRRKPDGSEWICLTTAAWGEMGRGSTVQMKCAKCHNFCTFYR